MPWVCRIGHADHNNVGTDLSDSVYAEQQLIVNRPALEPGPVAWLVQSAAHAAHVPSIANAARTVTNVRRAKPPSPPPWRIMVTCALGHANVFTVSPGEAAPAHDVAGQPPTAKDSLASVSVAYLAPDKQVDRVIARAQTIIGATSIFGTIFTAFGFIGASRLATAGGAAVGVIIAAVACLAVALSFAFAALVVDRGHMDLSDPDSVWDHFDDIITRRWRLTAYSSYVFVLAILLTLVAAIIVLMPPHAAHA